jgi:hypothetical protein
MADTNYPVRKIQFTPIQARELIVKRNIENSQQILVDHALLYLDHCKVHPIDLALSIIKNAAEEGEKPYVCLYPRDFFNNLDYEEKLIKKSGDWPDTFWQRILHKKVHHEWVEKDMDNYKHYWKLLVNIMTEIRNYLWKAGWAIDFGEYSEGSGALVIKVYL